MNSRSPARHRGPNCSAAPVATTTSTKAGLVSPTYYADKDPTKVVYPYSLPFWQDIIAPKPAVTVGATDLA